MSDRRAGKGKGKGSDDEHARVGEASEEFGVKLHSIKEAMGEGEGTAQVYRKLPHQSKRQFLTTMGTDDLLEDPHETLKSLFGGGDYHIAFHNEKHEYVTGGSLQVNIAGKPLHPDGDDPLADLEAKWEERLTKGSGGGSSAELVLAMIQMQRDREPAERTDPLEVIAAMVAAISPLVVPFLEAKLVKPEPAPDQLDQLARMAQLMASLKELAGDSGGSAVEAVTKHLAPSLGKLLESAAGQTPVTQQPPGADAVAAPPWFPLLERALPQLLQWAGGGRDAELRADLVLDELPDDLLGPMYEQLSRGDEFTAEFYQYVPAAGTHRDWFNAFFARIHAQIRPLEEGELEERKTIELRPSTAERLEEGELGEREGQVDTEATA